MMNTAAIADSCAKDIMIKTLTGENITLKEQQANGVHTQKSRSEDKSTEARTPRMLPVPNPAVMIEGLQTSIIEKIKDVIGTLIDEKLQNKLEKTEENHSSTATQANKSFAEAVSEKLSSPTSNTSDFRALMRTLIMNRSANIKKRRGENEILSYMVVKVLTKEVLKSSLMYCSKILVLNPSLDQNKRPIIVELQSEQDKDKIMRSLRNLKGKTDYNGISITDDHTVAERELISDYRRKAKELNAKNETGEYLFCVRGTPKN